MHCSKCGTKLPEDAAFCFKCGRPVGGGQPDDSTKWEYCQIKLASEDPRYKLFGLSNASTQVRWYTAPAIGPNGKFDAGTTPKWRYDSQDYENEPAKRKDAHDQLVKHLLSTGWELSPDSDVAGDALRFRRRAK